MFYRIGGCRNDFSDPGIAFIGYEPSISLKEKETTRNKSVSRKKIFHLGLAGFCFSNIMMLSFPEYFSSGKILEAGLQETFTWLIFALSLPVLFISASAIFISAFKGLRQKDLNIDVPIALAIGMTFGRSYYEIFTGTGAGFLDSGTGIIFFMLVGRWFQAKTNDSLAFDRDYQSYFPLGVTVSSGGKEKNIPVTKLNVGDTVILKSEEMLPADAVLEEGQALMDYSFVTGENDPVSRNEGDVLYAGGKQKGGRLVLKVIKAPSQSYITELWNNEVFSEKPQNRESFVHPWSRYFTIVLLSLAVLTGAFWYVYDPSKIFPAVTAMLIVACPCSLLLSSTFTFGGMLRYFGKNKLFLKNSMIIEQLAAVNTIVFDKTGTVTESENGDVRFNGEHLTANERQALKRVASQSSHTLSVQVAQSINEDDEVVTIAVDDFKEYSGKGVEAKVNDRLVRLGSSSFMGENLSALAADGSRVYVAIDGIEKGYFEIRNKYREGFKRMIWSLTSSGYDVYLLSGDNASEQKRLRKYFGNDLVTHFNASPQDKLAYVKELQQQGMLAALTKLRSSKYLNNLIEQDH
ncbi:MAG: HAD family hydrolase, partial [Chitinophagaceae bacterium]